MPVQEGDGLAATLKYQEAEGQAQAAGFTSLACG